MHLRSRVLFLDDDMVVLDKPAGIAVHRGPKGGPVLEDGFAALAFGLKQPPSLAHRLDKDTSGCLVLGRHRASLAALGRRFAHGDVKKTYWSVVRNGPVGDEGSIDAPLAKRDERRGWFMTVDPDGQPARTDWRVLGRAAGMAWLEFVPLTGRTHQLRVHAAYAGFPILGDPIYGRAPVNGPRLHLHARAITLPGRGGRTAVTVTAPVPEHMRAGLTICGFRGDEADPRVAGGRGGGW